MNRKNCVLNGRRKLRSFFGEGGCRSGSVTSNASLRLDLNTSRELFSLTGGGVRLNVEYVPVQAIKIDEALKAIPMSES